MGWIARLIAEFMGGVLLSIAGSMLGRLLSAAGVGAVTYVGVNTTLSYFKSGVVNSLLGLPATIAGLLSLMQVGVCISMVFSAMVIRMTLQGLTSDTVKKWVKK